MGLLNSSFMVFLFISLANANNITSCPQVISVPNSVWYLSNNLTLTTREVCLNITSSNVTIQGNGFTISANYSVQAKAASQIQLANISFTNFVTAISFVEVTSGSVEYCNFTDAGAGEGSTVGYPIYLQSSTNVTLLRNVITQCTDRQIYILSCSDIYFLENNISSLSFAQNSEVNAAAVTIELTTSSQFSSNYIFDLSTSVESVAAVFASECDGITFSENVMYSIQGSSSTCSHSVQGDGMAFCLNATNNVNVYGNTAYNLRGGDGACCNISNTTTNIHD